MSFLEKLEIEKIILLDFFAELLCKVGRITTLIKDKFTYVLLFFDNYF